MSKEKLILIIILLIGAFLRLSNLGQAPLWVDEAYYCTEISTFHIPQEFLPAVISNLFSTKTEYLARLPFALAGILTILAIYWASPKSEWRLWLVAIVAVFPLFVFYSRMCKPYSIAGLLIVLGWRWSVFYYPILLTTPIALIGIDFTKVWKKKYTYALLLIISIGFLLIRSDINNPDFFTWSMFTHQPRLWYIPTLAGLMYLFFYVLPKIERNKVLINFVKSIIIITGIFFLNQSYNVTKIDTGPVFKAWYSHPIYYNNWRGMPQIDVSTNFPSIAKYYTGKDAIILRRTGPYDQSLLLDSIFNLKDTVYVGIDSYANHISNWFFPPQFLQDYGKFLYNGNVIYGRVIKQSNKTWFLQIIPREKNVK